LVENTVRARARRTEDVFTRTIFTFECFNWQMRRPTLVAERPADSSSV